MNLDICYLTLPVESADQAASLATYLNKHGVEAVAELNEVTCPIHDPAEAAPIYGLRRNWTLYWENSDAEIFGLPVFVKDSACCSGSDQ
ncbi:hypothetical protein SEA_PHRAPPUCCINO_49 [Mycobacterium phage Phrappuccino]|uniref:Uncharacterized protein n=1 Tax=Mycobacterium phage Phrappuccino TaxID=2591223 RepID=A0A514DDP3_9CAUD|nr:hypothetical protein KHQ87_gp049 [Mycobacterium phage Phrappuccino]QDH91724.1 hypothetical protein SEA_PHRAPPUCCINO_49 [Mycobacterium phage Phrappuccino]QIQ63167.1 hypothetical protein SEA_SETTECANDELA_49 [Mycobacterium phage Settecandela]